MWVGPVGAACAALAFVALSARQADMALSATPESWDVISGLQDAVSAQRIAARREIRLGLDGDIALPTPSAHGLVVAGRNNVAALASDQALADAAFLPRGALRNLAPPPLAPSAAPRMAGVARKDAEALTKLETAATARLRPADVDAEMSERLGVAAFEGRDRLAEQGGAKQLRCMAEALYFEARGESVEGQAAVAEVVLNRVDSKYWPDTVCGVINQGSHRKTGCQFSYTCDGKPETITSDKAWETAERISRLALMGAPRRLTDHATHYHATYVSPRWALTMEKTAKIDTHIFFRRLIRVARKSGGGEAR